VNAGLGLGWIEYENRFAVFLPHGVVAGNGYLAESGICAEAMTKNGVVGGIGDERDPSRSHETRNEQPPQKTVDAGFQGGTHGVQL
jgi:hypothetical protein